MSHGPIAPPAPPVPAPPPPVEAPSGWNSIVPAIVGLLLWGVQVILVAEAQMEYLLRPSMVAVFPETSQFPLGAGSGEMSPAVPGSCISPLHMHPPSALVVQVSLEYPIDWI